MNKATNAQLWQLANLLNELADCYNRVNLDSRRSWRLYKAQIRQVGYHAEALAVGARYTGHAGVENYANYIINLLNIWQAVSTTHTAHIVKALLQAKLHRAAKTARALTKV